MADYLKSFIVGSSLPVFAFYFYKVSEFKNQGIVNFSYPKYALIAPLYLGTLNTIGLWLSKNYSLNKHKRFFVTGLLGATLVAIFITMFKIYPYDNMTEWIKHYIGLFIVYIVIFSVIVYWIDTTLEC